jgi:hypothetical protein
MKSGIKSTNQTALSLERNPCFIGKGMIFHFLRMWSKAFTALASHFSPFPVKTNPEFYFNIINI